MAAIFSRRPLFLSNAHYVNHSNSDIGITFYENTLLIMSFWKTVLVPQKFKMATIFQVGHYFSWILTSIFQMVMLSSNLVQIFFKGHSHGKKVCATQKFKMATIFKMAIISIRAQFNVLWTVLFNRVNIVTQPGYTGDFTAVELSMGFNVSWSSFTYNVVLD